MKGKDKRSKGGSSGIVTGYQAKGELGSGKTKQSAAEKKIRGLKGDRGLGSKPL
jgi:hypothetical protein